MMPPTAGTGKGGDEIARFRAMDSPSLRIAGLALVLASACSTDTVPGQTSTTTSVSTESGASETETGWQPGDPETETEGEPSFCVCDPGQICVSDCEPGSLGIPGTDPMQINLRCVDDPACLDDPLSPQCVHDNCGHELASTLSCGDSVGADLICASAGATACDPGVNDCPDDDKCALIWLEIEQQAWTMCVPVAGDQGAGAPCSSEGIVTGIDDCDRDSVCFGTEPSLEPFEATCKPMCQGTPDDPDACPAGFTCTVIPASEGWFVCQSA